MPVNNIYRQQEQLSSVRSGMYARSINIGAFKNSIILVIVNVIKLIYSTEKLLLNHNIYQ